MIRGGDFSMLKVWAGLEARSFLQASIESVSPISSSFCATRY
jgi:aarF domain-containing kinase